MKRKPSIKKPAYKEPIFNEDTIWQAPERLREMIYQKKLLDTLIFSMDIDLYSNLSAPLGIKELSKRMGIESGFMERLLKALIIFGFIEKVDNDDEMPDGSLYVNSRLSEAYLNRNSLFYLIPDVFKNVEIGSLLNDYVEKGPSYEKISNSYWSPDLIMSIASLSMAGNIQDTINSVDLTGRKSLLDIGGGHGLYSIFFTKRYRGLKAEILDLPQVVDVAKELISKYSAEKEVATIAGDYHDFRTNKKYDVILISNVTSSYEDLNYLISLSHGLLNKNGIIIMRNYVNDITSDIWSPLVVLERYSRRGKDGFSSKQLISALNDNGFIDIKRLYEGYGIMILQGIKE
jgi:hypothetical protein